MDLTFVISIHFVFIALDLIFLSFLRRLVYSFLMSKRNIKGAKKIHLAQSRKARFTLSYIRNHTKYPKEFDFWHRFYIITLWIVIFQYAAIITLNVLLTSNVYYIVIVVLCAIKFIGVTLLRLQFDSGGYVSQFDKRYNKWKR